MHGSYLKRFLPDRVLECLKLTPGTQASSGLYEAVLSRLRLLADTQIERFTRGKYIPKLYVRRKLEDDVRRFLLPDTQVAAVAKASCVTLIEVALTQIQNHPGSFDLRTEELKRDVARLKELRARDKTLKDTARLLADMRSRLSYRLKIRDSAKALIANLLDSLHELLKEAHKLPDTHFDRPTAFKCHIENMASFVSFLDAKVKEFPGTTGEDSSTVVNRLDSSLGPSEHAIAMLSDGGFILKLKERFEHELTNVESLLKNTFVIIDRAGGGKTNLICNLVQSLYITQPIIVFFGKEHFESIGGLQKATTDTIARCYGHFSNDLLSDFDRLLAKEDQHLTIFIDGINENRHLGDLDLSIESFLEWAQHHRIRIIITCRDIYWEFFNSDNWARNVQRVIREQLNQFAPTEYDFALPLYLDHYNINCTLAADAKEACHHPLLLRFFCEAYGSIEGKTIDLGDVWDIRLKELFDVYLRRKTEQIRTSMEHRNPDLVFRYLFSLVAFLFKNFTTAISTSELEDATGDPDTSTRNSLYLHLLDEDIIIEEEPAEEVHKRRVSFVYEEFMEYLLASSVLLRPKSLAATNVSEIFATLDASLAKWVNVRGVGEYIALMLLGGEHGYSRHDAITFLGMMARSGKTWCEAFWSVVSKCSENQLGPDLFDEFYFAIDTLSHPKTIVKALNAMFRYDRVSCNKLASIILWSSTFPKVLGWTELSTLEQKNEDELAEVSKRLCSRIETKGFSAAPGNLSNEKFLESVIPFLETKVKRKVEDALRQYRIEVGGFGIQAFLLFSKSFPEHTPFLINGLFSLEPSVRSFCAYRLRFEKDCAKQVSSLCKQLAAVESDQQLRRLLQQSAYFLDNKGRTVKRRSKIRKKRFNT
jgi:hypothetical protein